MGQKVNARNDANVAGAKIKVGTKSKNTDVGKDSQITADEIYAEVEQLAQPTKEITGEDLLNDNIDSIPVLVEPFLHRVGLACLAGSSDTGKSSLLRQLAIDISTGSPNFLGFPILATHNSAIFVSTEDDQIATSYLLKKQTQGFQAEQVKNLRFLFDTDNLLSELDTRLTSQPADLVVIDCFSDAYGGDLKDTQKIRSYLHSFQILAQKHQCLFLFLHHTGKRTEGIEPNKNNLLSGQGFEAKMRLVIELRADATRADIRHLCIVKGNYLPASYKRESFVLNFIADQFRFDNSDERTPFEMLVKRADDEGRAKYEQAKELRDDGKTLDEIAEIMGYANRGSVSKLLKRFGDVS